MTVISRFIICASLLGCLQPVFASGMNARAVEPTTSGQIGVNPVSLDIGPASKWIGVNTEYLTELVTHGSTSYKWIGVNTIYLTKVVGTITNNAGPTVVTSSVGAIASTATAKGNGLGKGDVTLTFSPALRTKLETLATTLCGGPGRRQVDKRDGAACTAENFGRQAIAHGGPLDFEDFPWPTITANDIAEVVAAIGNRRVAIATGAGVAVLWFSLWRGGDSVNVMKIPAEDVDHNPDGVKTSRSTTSTSTSACPKGSDMPVCQDQLRCRSPNTSTCTTKVKYEHCQCQDAVPVFWHKTDGQEVLAQQSSLDVMASVIGHIPAMTTMSHPYCIPDGADWMIPTSWCDCGLKHYPTVAQKSDATSKVGKCDYTELPSKTIKPISNTASPAPTNVIGKNGVSECQHYLAANAGYPEGTPDFCFCGGGPEVPPANASLLTHSNVHPPKTDCAYKIQPTPGYMPHPPKPKKSPGPTNPRCGGSFPAKWNMLRDVASSAVDRFCAQKASELYRGARLAGNWPGTCAMPNKNPVFKPPANGVVKAGQGDIVIGVSKDVDSPYCKDKSYSDLEFSQIDCTIALKKCVDGCDTDTRQTKHGAYISVNCLVYSIYPTPFGQAHPCEGEWCPYGWFSGDNCSP